MLNKFFAKPIEITVGEQSLKFNSLADFEFSLAGRTSVPSKKITGMVKFSTDELKKEDPQGEKSAEEEDNKMKHLEKSQQLMSAAKPVKEMKSSKSP